MSKPIDHSELKNSLLPLLVVVGPTATGKSAVAIELAKILDGEVISADSMLVYRGMDIGTAKPKFVECTCIPHHMIDIVEPDEEFNVAIFQERVHTLIPEICQRNHMPILAGGTGLYIKSITDHYNFPGSCINQGFRQQLQKEAEVFGPALLHKRLQLIDPASATRIYPNNLRRVIRALEVFHLTGVPISSFQDKDKYLKPKYNLAMFGLMLERQELYRHIDERVDLMIKNGLAEEVNSLLKKGYSTNHTAMQGLGYKEIVLYLKGEISLADAIALIKRNTRRFAKRQLTWFRKDPRIKWLKVEAFKDPSEIAGEIARLLEDYSGLRRS